MGEEQNTPPTRPRRRPKATPPPEPVPEPVSEPAASAPPPRVVDNWGFFEKMLAVFVVIIWAVSFLAGLGSEPERLAIQAIAMAVLGAVFGKNLLGK